ncbi:MAG: NAD(P)/FAD-dependent oxidoreductase, partial [Flammeovirgaceae bacterium]
KQGMMGPELMELVQKQAEHFGAKMVFDEVRGVEVDKTKKTEPFKLLLGGKEESFDAVIIASGASAKYLGIPGEEQFVGKGYHSCATCDGFFYRGKTIAVAGGGDSAMEEANFLTKFADKVYLIHRREEFRASKIMLERAKNNPKIEFILNKKIVEFIGSDQVTGIKLEDTKTGKSSEMSLDGVFVAIGHTPNTGFVKGKLDMNEVGYLVPQSQKSPEDRTSKYLTMSSVEGIFVAGDVEDQIYRQAITAAGQGCKAAIDAEKWLEDKGE